MCKTPENTDVKKPGRGKKRKRSKVRIMRVLTQFFLTPSFGKWYCFLLLCHCNLVFWLLQKPPELAFMAIGFLSTSVLENDSRLIRFFPSWWWHQPSSTPGWGTIPAGAEAPAVISPIPLGGMGGRGAGGNLRTVILLKLCFAFFFKEKVPSLPPSLLCNLADNRPSFL